MQSARKFIGKLVIIAAGLLLADQLIGRWLAHAYARITHGEQGHITFVIDSTTAPLLVLGSSRAVHQYVPDILTDSLHLACYNAGKDGQGLFYSQAIVTAVLKRYQPKALILDLLPTAFAPEESDFNQLAILLPYYHTHPGIASILDQRGPWESVKTLSYLYCYNSLSLQIFKRSIADTEDDSTNHGYNPKFMSLPAMPAVIRKAALADDFSGAGLSATPDTTIVAAFQQLIALASQHGCRLAVIVSPVYFPLTTGSSTIHTAADICRRQHITFLDYSRSPDFCRHDSLFYDATHLNDSGARKFTRLLSADLHNSE
jgi:hypothetical protein